MKCSTCFACYASSFGSTHKFLQWLNSYMALLLHSARCGQQAVSCLCAAKYLMFSCFFFLRRQISYSFSSGFFTKIQSSESDNLKKSTAS